MIMLANFFFIVDLLIKDVNSQAALVKMEERMQEFKFCHKVCPDKLKVFGIYYNLITKILISRFVIPICLGKKR